MRRAKRLVTKLFLVCLIALPANGQPLTFDAGNVGGPRSDARAELFMPQGAGPFPAVVVLHGCDGVGRHYRMLILIGEADDWTPVDRCIRWRDRAEANGHALHLKTYPGALHGFEAPTMPHTYAGHYVGRHPEAAADALVVTRAFLAEGK
jgi:dienelactone hydrolase